MGIFTLFKKKILLLVLLLFVTITAFSQQYRTKYSGSWEDENLWEISWDYGGNWDDAYEVPVYGDIEIVTGHTVTVESYVDFNALTISPGAVFVVKQDAEVLFFEANVLGEIQLNGGQIEAVNSLDFLAGGRLKVFVNNATSIPIARWEVGSTCEIVGATEGELFPSSVNEFYNFIYNCPSQTINTYFPHDVIIKGDFTVNSTGQGSLILNSTGVARTITVDGNFVMNNGILDLDLLGNAITNVNIGGNFNFTNGEIRRSANAAQSNRTPYLNFVGTTPNINIINGIFSGIIYVAFVTPDAEINLNSSEFKGSGGRLIFTAAHRSILKTSHLDGIQREAGATTGNIQFAQSTAFPGGVTALTYEYNGIVSQKTGTAIQGNFSNTKVVVNNPSGVIFDNSTTPGNTISNANSINLQINQGFFDIGARPYVGTAFGGTGELRTQGVLPANQTWAGTVNYNGISQDIVGGQYTNLKLSGTGTKKFTGSINITDVLNISGANVDVNNQPVHYNGANQNVLGLNYNELFIEGSGTKTVIAPATVKKTLTVSNSVLNANGNITLLADASSSANVAPLLTGADIIGDLSTQIFITGGIRGNKTMSSPINDLTSGSNTYSQLKNHMILTGINGVASGFDAVPVGAISPNTLYTYDNAQSPAFVPISNVSDQILSGKGFIYFFIGNRDYKDDNPGKLLPPYKVPENVTLTYTGAINKGNINIPIAYNSGKSTMQGAYIAGNPYPATIDWENVYAASANISTTTTIVRGGGRPYATYNAVAQEGTNGGSRYIQPGQGFYVYANEGGGTLSFREVHKNVNAEPARLLNARETVKLVSTTGEVLATKNISTANSLKKLRLQLENGDEKEEALVVFGSGFNADFDDKDSPYNSSYSLKMATLSSDRKSTAINLMPELESIDTLRLSVNSSNSANVRLNFTDVSQVTGRVLMLRDNYLNIEQVISTDNNTYNFAIDKTTASSFGDDRLFLTFVSKVLPIVFSEIEAVVKANGIEIVWKVGNQSNDSKYIIERSIDGVNFENLGVVNSVENMSDYSFIDVNPLQGANYYRIKIDYANKQTLSKVVRATYNGVQKENVKFGVYPNPTERNVTVNTVFDKPVEAFVKQVDGKIVKRKAFTPLQIIDLDVIDLASGVYIIEVRNKELGDVLGISKFIKK